MGLANAVLIRLARVLICWYSELMNKTLYTVEFSFRGETETGCFGQWGTSAADAHVKFALENPDLCIHDVRPYQAPPVSTRVFAPYWER